MDDTENRCLNCGNDSPCSCTEPMPAAEVYARHRERQAAAAGQRYEPHCDLAAARAENERLTKERDEARAERDALMADSLYIIGVNHGWEEAVDYGQAHPVARAQMAGVSDEVLSELRPCPFCGGPVSFQGAAIRCNSFSCNASMSPRWTKAVVGSAKGDPDERLTLAKADCQRRWNRRATEADLRAANTPRAWLDVLAERRRQISDEGWTLEHDDQHDDGELEAAGATYALSAANCIVEQPFHRTWPWQNAWWKPTEPRRDLVKAGALILAEIERLDRADKQEGQARG